MLDNGKTPKRTAPRQRRNATHQEGWRLSRPGGYSVVKEPAARTHLRHSSVFEVERAEATENKYRFGPG